MFRSLSNTNAIQFYQYNSKYERQQIFKSSDSIQQLMKQASRKEYDYQYKFVMVGDSAVGKSSLLLRFADNEFNENYMITIGVDFRFKSVTVNNKIVKMQIWDTAGQERFRTIVNTYYKNANAVYLIFDLKSQESFNSIKNYWINEVQSYTDESAVIILVGNKCDQERSVSEEEIKSFVSEKNLHYYETSAKTGQNVSEMFIGIAQHLTENKVQGKNRGGSQQSEFKKLQDAPTKGEGSRYANCQC